MKLPVLWHRYPANSGEMLHSYAARMRIDAILASRRPVFSVEFFPPKTEEATEQLFSTARSLRELEPDFVSVTYGAGGSTREGTVEITRALGEEHGFETMAHLSCVGETAEGLSATLDRIEAAGIENVFALRGDPPRGQADFVQPPGGLGSAAELAAFISAERDLAIGGACFPEVHPEAPDLETDLDYLKTKVEAGASFLITQLFFDNQVYFDFVEAARAKGIDVPILAGVIPVASFAQTKRICDLCDASIPPSLEQAFLAAGDERAQFELGVAYAAQQCSELLIAGAPGIHFYALNRAPATRAVLGALRAARPWERGGARSATPPTGAVAKTD
jgi:methylenetetrahydrofolate reductase (NADPH)